MRNTFYLVVIVSFLILAFINIVGQTSFVPRPEKVHFGPITYPRRWGRWCSQDNECGLGFCRAYMCQCYPGYISWYYMEPCAYEQRKKLTAFLLSFFVGTFGVDWFYLSRGNAGYIIAGIIKVIISLGCFIGWPLALMSSKSEKTRRNVAFGNVINAIFTAASVIWWLTDWIRILSNVFYDGNGVPLQPWGYDYDFYNRIPFRYK
jgi:TM2 domain-containing membrane protein YozV